MTKSVDQEATKPSLPRRLVDRGQGLARASGFSAQGIKDGRPEPRLRPAGHCLLAGAVLALACAVVIVSRREAQTRQRLLGYCTRAPINLLEPRIQTDQMVVLPAATLLQRQRLSQQASDISKLALYHCKSMQFFSESYQSLATLANGSAMLSATMLVLLSLYGLHTAIRWPFTVLMASVFALGTAVVSIKGFNLQGNVQKSRALYLQTIVLARSFTTALANQEYRDNSSVYSLLDRDGVGRFLDQVDGQLSLVDIPIFSMDDSFAASEVFVLLHKTLPSASGK